MFIIKCLTVVASMMAMLADASRDILRPVICYNADTEALAAFNRGPCPKDTVAWRGAGANLFDVSDVMPFTHSEPLTDMNHFAVLMI